MLQMSRRELFDLIWSMPLTEISLRYDVRDINVAKACDAHDIPRPPTGHWQKHAFSKGRSSAPLLPEDRFSGEQEVVVLSTPSMARRRETRLTGTVKP